MDLRQVAYVLAVLDSGSFTAGAADLGVAQPTLSEAVRRLEAELGVPLFERVGRRVMPSAAGRAFEGPARQLLRDRDAVLDAVGRVHGLTAGNLDLVALPTLVVDPLAPLIGAFRVAHPGIVVRLAEPEGAQAVEAMVADGRSELGLTELPLRRDDLVSIRLGTQEIVAVCPPNGPVRGSRVPLTKLAGVPLVASPPGTSIRDLVDAALAGARITPLIAIETAQREAIPPLVLGGAGVAFLPRPIAEPLREQGAVVASLEPALRRTIGVVHRAAPLSPAARAFVEAARQEAKR